MGAREARWYESLDGGRVRCELCPHYCEIAPGRTGRCRVRRNDGGTLASLTYAQVASVALDPIEKKPLYHFYPARPILSIGTWGCNFRCAFCQNASLSQQTVQTQPLPPEQLPDLARQHGSIGVAFTYNEPTIWYEYVRDGAQALREAGLKTVLVSNGFINPKPLAELLPWVDALNIDLKASRDQFYQTHCGGALTPVLNAAKMASEQAHLEVTTLLIPGENSSPGELEQLAAWIAENCGAETPAHLSAYSPRYKFTVPATPVPTILGACSLFRQHLRHVYAGNIRAADYCDTMCVQCGATVIHRSGYTIDCGGMNADGTCAGCGAANNILTEPS